ncbi:hypothetical protein [Gemmatimonas sp.]|uniref:hypothetical protein n=1 Tax=Gemmatimonas sp. TaxID=1962908 RepID=UPI0035693257
MRGTRLRWPYSRRMGSGPAEVADALKWVGQTLPAIRHVLVGRDGTLAAELKPSP